MATLTRVTKRAGVPLTGGAAFPATNLDPYIETGLGLPATLPFTMPLGRRGTPSATLVRAEAHASGTLEVL